MIAAGSRSYAISIPFGCIAMDGLKKLFTNPSEMRLTSSSRLGLSIYQEQSKSHICKMQKFAKCKEPCGFNRSSDNGIQPIGSGTRCSFLKMEIHHQGYDRL
jgi:hypothetical protein